MAILLLFSAFDSSSHQRQLMVFHWSLGDSKSPLVSMTLLSVLADLNNAVVWMISTHPLIFKSSSPCTNPLVTIPSVSITISITVTFMFHVFFSSLARSSYFSLFSLSFSFTLWSTGTDSELYIYHLFVWSNLNLFHNSKWITFFTQSCLLLYCLCANLQHSLIMGLIVSSLSPHSAIL